MMQKSPCKNICTLDTKGKCVGCFRTIDEIAFWDLYSENDKKEILKVIECRMKLPKLMN